MYKPVSVCCDEFLTFHPELNDADKVMRQCIPFSEQFLIEYPELKGELLYLCGHRYSYARRHRGYDTLPNPDPTFCHTVCLFPNDIVVDLTYRQLNTHYHPIHISWLDAIRSEWLLLSHKYQDPITCALRMRREVAALSFKGKHIKIPTRHHPTTAVSIIQAWHIVNFYIQKKALQMTGNESDNPYIKAHSTIEQNYLSV